MATQTLSNPAKTALPAWLGKRALAGLALFTLAALVAGFLAARAHAAPVPLTVPAVRQTLTQTVTASGTVSPQNEVTVGSQISGTISALYVDYNSKVTKGEVLARIDTSTLQAQVDQAAAGVAQAQAQAAQAVSSASADRAAIPGANAAIAKAQSALALTQKTLTRDQTLLAQGYVARSQVASDQDAVTEAAATLQSAQASAEQTGAQAGGGGAGVQAAQAAVAAQVANLQQNSLNLQRAAITSPVDGTVIDREISVGQTVAASLQTPTLFTIAQNLDKMEVAIAVGEPDIGSVRPGENVDFTVLAYPNHVFHGVVSQVRDNPVAVSNVVTYSVITLVNNQDGMLLPGMTANATIRVASAPNALVVPVVALHQHSTAAGGSPWGQTSSSGGVTAVSGSTAMIQVLKGGRTMLVPVRVDLVSGTQAAVTSQDGTLQPGDAVVIANGSHARTQRPGAAGAPLNLGGSGGFTRGVH
jgi:HlyD family secretion protein